MSDAIDRLREEIAQAQTTLAEYRSEYEGLPALIQAADRATLTGPESGIEAALTRKKDLAARTEALDILIFRTEEKILQLEARQVDERLKPMAAEEEAATNAEAAAMVAFETAAKQYEEAQARRRQVEHDRTTLQREAERLHHAVYQHRNEHNRRMKVNA